MDEVPRGVWATDDLHREVRVDHTGIYDVTVHREPDGALLAELRAVSRLLPAPPKQVTEARG